MTRPNPIQRALPSGLVAVCLVAALAGACGRDAGPARVRVVDRLINAEPAGAFEDSVAGAWVPLIEWDLRTAGDRQRWEIVAGDDWDSKGLPLKASLVRLRVTGSVETAADAAGLRLDLSVPRRCRVAAHWPGAPDALALAPPPSPESTVRLDLASSPAWTGTAESLVVTLRNCRGGHLQALALEGRSEQVDERLTDAWKVTLENDTRRALLAVPGTERSWKLTQKVAAGRLRLGVGATHPLATPVRLTIGARRPGGDESPLIGTTLAPQEPGASLAWRELTVDLLELPAGSEIYLRADSEEPWRPGDGLPAFAEPRILAGSADPRPNVLLLSIDTLRADRLSLYGYERETSPNLDRRARSAGINFSSVVAPAGWTLPSHVSMLSGVEAVRHGVNNETTPFPSAMRFVAESLRDAGYETVAFTAGGYVSPEFGFSRGFESFRARRPKRRSVEVSRKELGHGIDQITAWLAEPRDQPFFAFFHTYEVHAPFWAREPYFERFGGVPEDVPAGYAFMTEDRRQKKRSFVIPGPDGDPLPNPDRQVIERLYDSGIAYMDSQIERLFEALEASGQADNTIVVLTSDHGESLGEHDLIGHGQAYDEVVMIPLVLWVPGVEDSRSIDAQVRLVDVTPTILDLVGLAEPSAGLDGQSLRPLWEGSAGYEPRPAWIHAGRFGIAMRIADRLKYVWHRVPWGYFGVGEQLFDLREDPAESRDLSETDHELLSSARSQAQAWLRDHLPGPRVTIENESSERYELRLTSDQNRAPGVTGFDCAGLDWKSPATLILRLDPGQSCNLVLEHLRASDLAVEARLLSAGSGSGSAGLKLAASELASSTDRILLDGVWQLANGGLEHGLHLQVEWLGEPAVDEAGDIEIDEALADQLRALGYLE